MAFETILMGLVNLLAGILILAIPGSLRAIVGGYLLLSGALIVLLALV